VCEREREGGEKRREEVESEREQKRETEEASV